MKARVLAILYEKAPALAPPKKVTSVFAGKVKSLFAKKKAAPSVLDPKNSLLMQKVKADAKKEVQVARRGAIHYRIRHQAGATKMARHRVGAYKKMADKLRGYIK